MMKDLVLPIDSSRNGLTDSVSGRAVQRFGAFAYWLAASIGEAASVRNPANAAVASDVGVPEYLVQLVIAIEDKRYWLHPGIDPIGAVRASWMNLRSKGCRQGASTIPEQIAKFGRMNSPRRPVIDRCTRATRSMLSRLGAGNSRKQVLAMYLRNVYLGRSCYGFHGAAWEYFGVDASRISEGQALFLVDRVASPNRCRTGRVRNVLKRAIVYEVVKGDLHAIPNIYASIFGSRVGDEIRSVLSELRYDNTHR